MGSRTEVAELLVQTHWVRSLARSLARDAHLAEDLAQDAWVAALAGRPGTERSIRGWLATVLRHRWRDHERGRARREERERESARREELPAAGELVERASLQRQLVGAVLELDEPYRSTVLLRFFEELPQREIARRMRTTTATVNSRLTRALAELRERLSRQGGPSAWLRILVPLLRGPEVAPAVALGVAVKSFVVAAVALVTLVVGFVLWRSSATDGGAEGAPALAAVDSGRPRRTEEALPVAQRAADDERERVQPEAARAVAPAAVATPARVRTLRGRVLNAAGVGLEGVPLALGSLGSGETEGAPRADVACTSGLGGAFEVELSGSEEEIVCADPRFETVLAGSARVAEGTNTTVVVAPRIRLAGIVVDEEARPLADAWIGVRPPSGFGADWGLVLDFSLPQRWVVRTGADGRFELAAAPVLAGATLSAALGGFAPHVEAAPQADAGALELVLSRPTAELGILSGFVLDPGRSPVQGAYVSAGVDSAVTDRDGEFALDVARAGTGSRLYAVKSGWLPATLEARPASDGRLAWPERVVLQLGGTPGRVRGRVVDHSGATVSGAKVWIDDPTHFGDVEELRLSVEPLVSGDERFWSHTLTDARGEFELGGLLDRSYRLQAIDPRSLAMGEASSVRAGDPGVEIRLSTDDVHARVAGRVTSRRGQPLAGVRVRLYRETFVFEFEGGKDNDGEEGTAVVTCADGAFEFARVPRRDLWVIASGDAIISEGVAIEEVPDPAHLEMAASLRLHLQVELAEPRDRADALALLTEDGRTTFAMVIRAEGSHAMHRVPLVGGRSDVLAVDEGTATVVLYRAQAEVARIPLHMVGGELNLIRY